MRVKFVPLGHLHEESFFTIEPKGKNRISQVMPIDYKLATAYFADKPDQCKSRDARRVLQPEFSQCEYMLHRNNAPEPLGIPEEVFARARRRESLLLGRRL